MYLGVESVESVIGSDILPSFLPSFFISLFRKLVGLVYLLVASDSW